MPAAAQVNLSRPRPANADSGDNCTHSPDPNIDLRDLSIDLEIAFTADEIASLLWL